MYTNRSRKTRASIKAKKTRIKSRSQSRRLRRSRSRPTTLRGGKNSRSRETRQKHNVRNGLALAALGGAAVLGGLSLRALQRQNTNAQRQNKLELRLFELQEAAERQARAAERKARETAERKAREAGERQAREAEAREEAEARTEADNHFQVTFFKTINTFVNDLNVCETGINVQSMLYELNALKCACSKKLVSSKVAHKTRKFWIKFFQNVQEIGDPKETGEYIDVTENLTQINSIVNNYDWNTDYDDSNTDHDDSNTETVPFKQLSYCRVLRRLNFLSSDVKSKLKNRTVNSQADNGTRCSNSMIKEALKTVTTADLMIEANKYRCPNYEQLTDDERQKVEIFYETKVQKQKEALKQRTITEQASRNYLLAYEMKKLEKEGLKNQPRY